MAQSPFSRFGATTITGTAGTQRRHVIVGGDTLPSITAYELNTGYDSELWRQIAEANGVDDLDALTVGQALAIPQPAASST